MWGRIAAFFGSLFSRGRAASGVAAATRVGAKKAAGVVAKSGLMRKLSWLMNAAFAFLIGKDVYDIFAGSPSSSASDEEGSPRTVSLSTPEAASILAMVLPDPQTLFADLTTPDRLVRTKLSGARLREKILAIRRAAAAFMASESPVEQECSDVFAVADAYLTEIFDNACALASPRLNADSIREASYRYQKYRWSSGVENPVQRNDGIEVLKYLYNYNSSIDSISDDMKTAFGLSDEMCERGSFADICDELSISSTDNEESARSVLLMVIMADVISSMIRMDEGKEVSW